MLGDEPRVDAIPSCEDEGGHGCYRLRQFCSTTGALAVLRVKKSQSSTFIARTQLTNFCHALWEWGRIGIKVALYSVETRTIGFRVQASYRLIVLCFSACSTVFCWTASPFRRRTWSTRSRARFGVASAAPWNSSSSSERGTKKGS